MNDIGTERLAQAVERVGMVLAAIYATHLGDLEQNLKVERLSRCGLSISEIAGLLSTTTNAVTVALHRARKGSKSGRKKGSGRS